jgi:predicted nucleic acid-binding protein
MPELPVVNASPLIILSRAGRLDLLQLVADRIIIPAAVAEEVTAHSDEAAHAISEHAWLEHVPAVPMSAAVAAWDLGAGESSVLSWAAAHPGCVAVIDDYAARTCAEVLGVSIIGTLGLALRAKARGRVPFARPLVEELRRAGLYLSDALIRDALFMVGE